MNPSDLNALVSIIVGLVAIVGAGIAVFRAAMTYRKNQLESRMSKVQNRIEYLKEQMNKLQNAAADFDQAAAAGYAKGENLAGAIAQARSVMFAIADAELDGIAARMRADEVENTYALRWVIADGIKRLARVIQEESTR